jgi:predicted RNase H-related nuclease YkuK (DUF458 family)
MENIRLWRKLDGTRIRRPIEDEVRSVLIRERALGNLIKVCIGTDSQVRGKCTEFATVIVFVRKGRGGFMFISHTMTGRRMSIKERMLMEVAESIEVAGSLSGLFTGFDVDMEVHADINLNPKFESHNALNEAMAHIKGRRFAFKAKLHAFASSCCADKVVQ